MLAESSWERPIYIAVSVGQENQLNMANHFVQEGLAYRFTPFDTNQTGVKVDSEKIIRGFEYSAKKYMVNTEQANEVMHTDPFRPPHGHMEWAQYMMLKRRYKIVMWDLVTRDYSKKLRGPQVLANVMRFARNGSIITFHDSLKSWCNGHLQYALPRSIEFLKEEGYEFKLL